MPPPATCPCSSPSTTPRRCAGAPAPPLRMAVGGWAQGVSGYLFSLLLGFNQAARWAMGDTVRRWLLLALVLPGYHLGGLRGAAGAVLLTELAALALAFVWSPPPRG